ncbi:hypothetical protein OAN307_c26390 [Octadecabacter antarcticus 307]|uniref:Uncharacterized protein n=1 Tax=Octadecabacter antarcticus 307 TaxID=391626 RepID=M9R8V5_9RHOB|nr:hypothetical protein OAN307_c26390 [Octadecabacter antarcticus 307]
MIANALRSLLTYVVLYHIVNSIHELAELVGHREKLHHLLLLGLSRMLKAIVADLLAPVPAALECAAVSI